MTEWGDAQVRVSGGPEWGQRDLHTSGAQEVWLRPGVWPPGAFGGPGRGCKQWTPGGSGQRELGPTVAPISQGGS